MSLQPSGINTGCCRSGAELGTLRGAAHILKGMLHGGGMKRVKDNPRMAFISSHPQGNPYA